MFNVKQQLADTFLKDERKNCSTLISGICAQCGAHMKNRNVIRFKNVKLLYRRKSFP